MHFICEVQFKNTSWWSISITSFQGNVNKITNAFVASKNTVLNKSGCFLKKKRSKRRKFNKKKIIENKLTYKKIYTFWLLKSSSNSDCAMKKKDVQYTVLCIIDANPAHFMPFKNHFYARYHLLCSMRP